MKKLAIGAVSAMMLLSACAQMERQAAMTNTQSPSADDLRTVSPALERYTTEMLLGEQWQRAELNARDRSIVTMAALISQHQMVDLPSYTRRALDSGVTPSEISELITHLAFYSGWANASAAVVAVKPIFEERGVSPDALPAVQPELLPLDEAAEAQRAAQVGANFGEVSPGVVDNTTNLLFRDLWLRPDLAPRDRSLVTVTALIANGQVGQIPYHLNRAMDNGLTQTEASEVLAHTAFYSGWPTVFSALPVFKEVFAGRGD